MILGVVLLGLTAPAWSGDVRHVGVTRDSDHYRLSLDMTLDAPAPRVLALITDYNHLDRLSEAIRESHVLSRAHGVTRVLTVAHACVLIFCATVRQVQEMRELPDGEVRATTVPGTGDLRYGVASWRVIPAGPDRCELRFQAEVVPGFWVPPIIGPWLLSHKMREEALESATRMERLAKRPTPPDAAGAGVTAADSEDP